jgi:hypothetical protein
MDRFDRHQAGQVEDRVMVRVAGEKVPIENNPIGESHVRHGIVVAEKD